MPAATSACRIASTVRSLSSSPRSNLATVSLRLARVERQMIKKIEVPDLSRRNFIGGSDARIIMGKDEAALLRLWRVKRGEVAREDLSSNSGMNRGPEPALV